MKKDIGAADELMSRFHDIANIHTQPTIGDDLHTAFIKFGPYASLRAESYRSQDDAADLLLIKIRELSEMLIERLR